eukprot:scaffold27650_cov21-Tisochrysis_lutea.AAC.1
MSGRGGKRCQFSMHHYLCASLVSMASIINSAFATISVHHSSAWQALPLSMYHHQRASRISVASITTQPAN